MMPNNKEKIGKAKEKFGVNKIQKKRRTGSDICIA